MEIKDIIKQLRENDEFSVKSPNNEQLNADFRQVLEVFIAANHSHDLDGSTLICSIHDSFPSHHSCVACNLHENAKLLERFLLYAEVLPSVNYSFTTLLLLMYLLIERIHVYLELTKIPDSYQAKYFQVFKEIKQWANFLKHPKSFMLALHPQWQYKGMSEDFLDKPRKSTVVIDSAFVKQYYSGDQNNEKLYKLLAQNVDVIVLFPNPVDLMERFTQAQKKFVSMIAENEMVREMLESQTMKKDLFSSTKEDTVLTASTAAHTNGKTS
jgi:hypothetical protein